MRTIGAVYCTMNRYALCVVSANTGVPGELYYCRNGVVNDYALSFNLPIKTDITEIYFSWVNAPPLGLQKPDITVSLHSLATNT